LPYKIKKKRIVVFGAPSRRACHCRSRCARLPSAGIQWGLTRWRRRIKGKGNPLNTGQTEGERSEKRQWQARRLGAPKTTIPFFLYL